MLQFLFALFAFVAVMADENNTCRGSCINTRDCTCTGSGRRRVQLPSGLFAMLDESCELTMDLVRNTATEVIETLANVGNSQAGLVTVAAEKVKAACQMIGSQQCVTYITLAEQVDLRMLEKVWLSAWGDHNDRDAGCAGVVQMVNQAVFSRRLEGVKAHDNKIVVDDSSAFRRLVGGSVAAGAVAAGTVLGEICRNYPMLE